MKKIHWLLLIVALGGTSCISKNRQPNASSSNSNVHEFRAGWSASLGPGYIIELKGGTLIHTVFFNGRIERSKTIRISGEAFEGFLESIRGIGITEWAEAYVGPTSNRVQIGPNSWSKRTGHFLWNLKLKASDIEISTSGRNGYPVDSNSGAVAMDKSEVFFEYEKALRRLIGSEELLL